MSKPVINLVCCDCGDTYLDTQDKKWSVARDPSNPGFSAWFHDCKGAGSKHRTREITMEADIVTPIAKAKPTRSRPGMPGKKSRPGQPWKKKTVGNPQLKKKEDTDLSFKLPFTHEEHSYGRKIVDATGRVMCWTPKPSTKNPVTTTAFIVKALTDAVSEEVDVAPAPAEPKTAEIPAEIAEALVTIEGYVQYTEKKLNSIRDAVQDLQDL